MLALFVAAMSVTAEAAAGDGTNKNGALLISGAGTISQDTLWAGPHLNLDYKVAPWLTAHGVFSAALYSDKKADGPAEQRPFQGELGLTLGVQRENTRLGLHLAAGAVRSAGEVLFTEAKNPSQEQIADGRYTSLLGYIGSSTSIQSGRSYVYFYFDAIRALSQSYSDLSYQGASVADVPGNLAPKKWGVRISSHWALSVIGMDMEIALRPGPSYDMYFLIAAGFPIQF